MNKFGAIFVAVLAVCVVRAFSIDVPTLRSCEITAANMGGKSFAMKALGGDAKCADAEDKEACCEEIRGLFSSGGSAEYCMCDKTFFSTIMMALPEEHNVDPTKYADMLGECNIPVAGRAPCPGGVVNAEIEPPVHSQIITSLLLLKALKGKKTPAPAPAPAPAKAPAPKPAPVKTKTKVGGGKKGQTILLVKEAAPAPAVVVATPKATGAGSVVAPKATAGAIPQPAVVSQPITVSQPVAAPQPVTVPTAPVVTAPAPAPAPAPVAAPVAPAPAPIFGGGSILGGSG